MNAPATKALLLDAVYQVLDNWVFRILAVLTGIVVLLSFVVGFREDEIVLFFGIRSWSYDTVFRAFGEAQGVSAAIDPQATVFSVVFTLIFDYLAGNLGVIFCIAATAFFVPQMIEKGAADVLFHKPLTRLTFYLARYFAGLLFVGLLACAMAAGLWAGFLVSSGYNDPGILVAGPLLTYLFGLIYAVSMLIGVLTRSTVASTLLTVMFFGFNGCIHSVWGGFRTQELQEEAAARLALEAAADEEDGASEASGEADAEEDEGFSFLGALESTVRTLHIALPKAGDADVMARMLRKEANPPIYRDGDTSLCVFRLGEDDEEASAVLPEELASSPDVRALLGEPRFAWSSAGERGVRHTLLRRERGETESRGRTKPESSRDAAGVLADTLARDSANADVDTDLVSFGKNARGRPTSARAVRWARADAGGPANRIAVVIAANDDWIHTLWIEDSAGPASQERGDELFEVASRAMGLEEAGASGERELAFGGPWQESVVFSVGSSLAFVAFVLLVGWFRLSRIEF